MKILKYMWYSEIDTKSWVFSTYQNFLLSPWNLREVIPNILEQILCPFHTKLSIYIHVHTVAMKVSVTPMCVCVELTINSFPGVASSTPARSHTFVEIDHEIISMVILLPSADSFKKGCCQLQAKVCVQITG